MATGCIMFKYCYFLTLSGFFVTETLFITAAHFNNDTNKPCQDGMPEDEVYQALQTEGNGIAQVNIRRFPTNHHKENKPVHLVHLDLVRDVAVFELDRGQAPVDAFLGHDALGNADTMEELDKNGTLFTIGYNSDVARDVFAAAATSYLEAILQNPERARYVKDHGPKGVLNTLPDFDCVLKPGHKSISSGKILPSIPTGSPEQRKQYSRFKLHSISGWYGISGAMIAYFDANAANPRIQVVGLFIAGYDGSIETKTMQPFARDAGNCFTPFDEVILDKISSLAEAAA